MLLEIGNLERHILRQKKLIKYANKKEKAYLNKEIKWALEDIKELKQRYKEAINKYVCNTIFGDFNLYGFEDLDFEKSKVAILDAFRLEYEDIIKKRLNSVGCKLLKLGYYSPKYYNFESDALSLDLSITNKDKLINYIKSNSEAITERLNANKSYDGYIATTSEDIKEVIFNIKNSADLDIMVLSVLFKDIKEELNDYNHIRNDNLQESSKEGLVMK